MNDPKENALEESEIDERDPETGTEVAGDEDSDEAPTVE